MGVISVLSFTLIFLSSFCRSDDQLTQAKPLSPGDVLVSKGRIFALGFFSPTNNSNNSLYIGIWYYGIPERTVVWVANRDNPITTVPSKSKLAITNSSELVLSDFQGRTLWTTTTTTRRRRNSGIAGGAEAVLLDSGNFVVRSPNGTDVLWQSFDHPTDTILPTTRFLLSYKAQAVGRLVAWKGPDDPSSGDISISIDPSSSLQIFVWNGTSPYSRPSVFNDFSGPGRIQANATTAGINQSTFTAGDRFYYTFRVSDGSPYTRIWLDYKGNYSFLNWNDKAAAWCVISVPLRSCDLYASCGPFGYCDGTGTVPTCRCPDEFVPVDGGNFSRGCRRKEQLECGKGDYFATLPEMKVPDKFLHVADRSFEQCTAECSRNCSCTAYAYTYLTSPGTIGGTSRCLVWSGDLLDMGKTGFAAQNLYLRLAVSPVEKKKKIAEILLPIIACLLLACIAVLWRCRFRGKQKKDEVQKRMMREYFRTDEDGDNNLDFPFISFQDIVAATDNFSNSSLLGKGGFGKVYKGMLEGTKEIAVKRLSKGSGQGTEEFRNEVALIVKLQHKNLVKLLGCSIHEDEKLLVYEYLPNKSLDHFLFDPARRPMLQWPVRCKIIQGIARGIMYLHQDSRLKIIHRDLKASNILLDMDMSPKISDFGMARIFYGDQPQANTNRVVGTYGYMSREYAMEGAFSVKSDTYSFGVLLLELVSGLKISSPHLIRDFPNLIAYAWNLWKDGKTEDLVDSAIKNNCPLDEVSRCIHIGLLCVQDSPDCRPLMSAVVFMLENKTAPLPVPKQPVYFTYRDAKPEQSSDGRVVLTVNGMSLTTLEGR